MASVLQGSSRLTFTDMQIKTTMKYYLIPDRITITKKTKCWWAYEEKGILYIIVQPLWKTIWRFHKKSKNRSTIWSRYLTSGYISKGNEISMSKRSLTFMFIAALFIILNYGINLGAHWWENSVLVSFPLLKSQNNIQEQSRRTGTTWLQDLL
jgi:hypothetical protein